MNLDTLPATKLNHHLGAIPVGGDRCRFVLWAPDCHEVQVELPDLDRCVAMEKHGDFFLTEVDDVPPGTLYFYRPNGGPGRPDPASRFQPQGVHGPSEVVDRAFPWRDNGWQGVSTEDLVIYETHVGCLTDEGTFAAAIERLDELADLGATAIELMPVADSAGRWNWGYDGVSLFAPHRQFGRPEDFRRLVDAAHDKGLAVILDVVYNHLGPEGNYWPEFGPYLSSRHDTVWGAAPNFDDDLHGEAVRRFFVANVIHWFDEYHVDALRVDAIHCMKDDCDPHIAAEMAEVAAAWSADAGRPAMLIAESNVYDHEMTTPLVDGGIGFDAQWCDDFLHSVFAVVRPGEKLCHRDYQPGTDLEQTLRMGYVYAGTLRDARGRVPSGDRPATHQMIYSIQNHDFIGNHPLGKRFHQLTSVDTQKAAAALLILCPPVPMLFMGEEFGCQRPFQFFVDFGDESLRQAVVDGRRREYPQHDWSHGTLPTDPAAYHESKIGPAAEGVAGMRDWYRELIACRKKWRAAGLLSDDCVQVDSDVSAGVSLLRYQAGDRSLTLAVRLVADEDAVAEAVETKTMGTETKANWPLDVEGELVLDSRPGETERSALLANHAKVFVVR